ncbi:MAG: amidohydrolase family protein [Chloroflexi bacterium]|nr:amidohydrolase family protein [Chloroflexota bacterium]
MTSPVAVDLLVLGGTVVTGRPDGRVLFEGAIAIADGAIAAVAPRREVEAQYAAPRTIDAEGMIVYPGLVDTHTHLYQTLLKGLGDDLPLMQWLDASTLPSIPHLTPHLCYVAAALGCIESLRSGCTTIFDYMVDHRDTEIYDAILQAFDDVGIQGVLGRGLRDRQTEAVQLNLPSFPDQLADCRRLLDRYGPERVWVTPGATWAMEEDSLRAARRLASDRGTRLSLHTDEVLFDSEESLRRFGQRTVPFLERIGFLGPDVLHAHCVQLSEEDCQILAQHGSCVSYNPVSNMYLGSGVPPIPRLLELGVTVGLGADGAASNNSQDMLEALKVGALLPKVAWRDPAIFTAADALRVATVGGAKALGRDDFGTLEPGKRADLFVFDPLHAKSVPVHDPVSTLVYSSGEVNVRTTIVGGRVVLDDRRIVGIDEDAILREAQSVALELSEIADTRRRVEARLTVAGS